MNLPDERLVQNSKRSVEERPPPRVIHAVFPDRNWINLRRFLIIAGSVCIFIVITTLIFGDWRDTPPYLINLAFIAFICLRQRRIQRRLAARSSEFAGNIASHDPLTETIVSFCSGRVPDAVRLRDSFPELTESPGAAVLFINTPPPPSSDVYYHEPELISKYRASNSATSWLWFSAVMLVVSLFYFFPVSWLPINGRVFALFTAIFLVSICFLIVSEVVLPTFVRLVPGLIQVIQYYPFRKTPTIVDYPMSAGTIVTVAVNINAMLLSVARGKDHYKLKLSNDANPDEAFERLQRILLSTAPTPEMSRDELVG